MEIPLHAPLRSISCSEGSRNLLDCCNIGPWGGVARRRQKAHDQSQCRIIIIEWRVMIIELSYMTMLVGELLSETKII